MYHHAARVISVKKEKLGKNRTPGFENLSSYNIYLNSIFKIDIRYQEAWFLGIIDDIFCMEYKNQYFTTWPIL